MDIYIYIWYLTHIIVNVWKLEKNIHSPWLSPFTTITQNKDYFAIYVANNLSYGPPMKIKH